MKDDLLFKKIFGCLAGGAVGDAMGAPVEAWHYESIQQKYGKITSLIPDLGVAQKKPYEWTDDTVLRHLICRTIIRKGGRITAYDLAEQWMIELKAGDPEGLLQKINYYSERFSLSRIIMGVSAREAGQGNTPVVDAALGITPIGIVNACHPRNAAVDAYDVAGSMQWDYAQEAAMAIAAAVAEAFKPDATINSIIEASTAYSGPIMKRRIEKAISIAKKYEDVFEARKEFYEKLLVPDENELLASIYEKTKNAPFKISISCNPLELVPISLAFFYIARGDPNSAMIGGTNFGRDCDGIAGFAGSIAGAYKGVDAIDMEAIKKVEEANNTNLAKLSSDMRKPVINVLRLNKESVNALDQLISS